MKRTERGGLRVGGWTPFSTIDYPGCLSAVVFCQGCPWRCRYCHNTHLQSVRGLVSAPPWSFVWSMLKERSHILDSVVFSGGEPTAQPMLASAAAKVRDLGLRVGLHTAGIFPTNLKRVLPFVDWVGLDIKGPLDSRMDQITRKYGSWRRSRESLALVLSSGVSYQIRTTRHPLLLSDRDLDDMRPQLGPAADHWTIQPFRRVGCEDPELCLSDLEEDQDPRDWPPW